MGKVRKKMKKARKKIARKKLMYRLTLVGQSQWGRLTKCHQPKEQKCLGVLDCPRPRLSIVNTQTHRLPNAGQSRRLLESLASHTAFRTFGREDRCTCLSTFLAFQAFQYVVEGMVPWASTAWRTVRIN